MLLLCWIFDVLLNQQRVGLGVDVFHGHLKAIEGSGLRNLDLSAEIRGQVFQDDAVTGLGG